MIAGVQIRRVRWQSYSVVLRISARVDVISSKCILLYVSVRGRPHLSWSDTNNLQPASKQERDFKYFSTILFCFCFNIHRPWIMHNIIWRLHSSSFWFPARSGQQCLWFFFCNIYFYSEVVHQWLRSDPLCGVIACLVCIDTVYSMWVPCKVLVSHCFGFKEPCHVPWKRDKVSWID